MEMMRKYDNIKMNLNLNVTFTKTDGKPVWWDEYQYAILVEEWGKI